MVDVGVDFGPDRGARNVGVSPGVRHQLRGSWVLPRGETGGGYSPDKSIDDVFDYYCINSD